MKKKKLILTLALTNFIVVFACFWDTDTIEMERQQFPSVIELISGKFLRHSPEFHYWRIKDRELKLEKHPDSLGLYDDLAVSYSKTGNDKRAIEIMLDKENIKPGLYETYANLGTFYLHDGQLKKGIKYIDKAVKINPNAHFGREVYQRYVAEYVLSKMKNGKITLPLNSSNADETYLDRMAKKQDNFYDLILTKFKTKLDSSKRKKTRRLPEDELEQAVIGVLGMMKFGNYNSPILLEVLGDLLIADGRRKGARQLAARAYFSASYQVEDKKAKEAYMKNIAIVLFHQYTNKQGGKFTIYDLEKLLKEEIQDGNNFYKQIKNNEIRWIYSGMNPEKAFAKKYYEEPKTPIRIQHSTGNGMEIEMLYIRNQSIGKLIDYRPIPKREIKIDSTLKYAVDSIFERKLVKEEKPINIDNEDSKLNTESKWTKPVVILSILLVLLTAIGIWLRTRKKNKRSS